MAQIVFERRISVLGALRHPGYRLFFTATVLANVAEWMQQFVLGWFVVQLAVADGHPERGPFYLGLLGLARLVPALGLGLVGGVVADRFDRARVLMATRLATAVVVATMAALTLTDHVNILIIMLLSGISACAFVFDHPSRMALIPSVVPAREALSALGLTRSVIMASGLIGPLVGGVLIVPLEVGGVMVVCTILSILAALTLSRMPALPPQIPGMLGTPLQSMIEGLRYVRGETTLRWFIPVAAVYAMFGNAVGQLMPAVARDMLQVGVVELSWLSGASGLGALTGAIAVASIGGWGRPGRLIIGAALVSGLLLLLFSQQRALLPAVGICWMFGTASMIYNGGSGTVIQTTADPRFRGRVLGVQMTGINAGIQSGLVILGTLGTLIGVSNALLVAGTVVTLCALTMSRIRVIRDVSERRSFSEGTAAP